MSDSSSRPIRRLLIANRGEIARRILRTAQDRGIFCVAVYSDPDEHAPFVAEADAAFALGGTTSAESYLDADKILTAARRLGCDAIHPGYGFLSENAAFAQAVLDAGITWVGPSPRAISAMAEKVPAKRLVAAAGVPLVPGAELEPGSDIEALADEVGYPVMVKASAGGGGKGMRIVESRSELLAAVETARREAQASFGDATVFLERYLPAARHIEVQVFGDVHGNVAHLFERECSIQRRHQKVVEEAPAPRLADGVRSGLRSAAVAAAAAIDYVGAGTVEFLVSGDEYFFLEMNTRLQVEHPVTEEVAGLDLVGLQLDVAEGLALPSFPAEPRGHAIEVRLYAEDARHDDLPSTGTITTFTVADPRIRLDSGVVAGSVVSPFYDPMLAKVIAHGRTRDEAAARLAAGLRSMVIHGVTTNRDMLTAIVESRAFLEDVTTTAFLDDHADLRQVLPDRSDVAVHAVAAAAGVLAMDGLAVTDVGPAEPGWRNVPRPAGLAVGLQGDAVQALGSGGVAIHREQTRGGGFRWGVGSEADRIGLQSDDVTWMALTVRAEPVGHDCATVVVLDEAVRHALTISRTMDVRGGATLWVDSNRDHTRWQVPARFDDADASAAGAGPSAPVPGTITAVLVGEGETVEAGQTLVVLEAMKMEHRINADSDGIVGEVLVRVGAAVDAHEVVVRLEPVEGEDA